MKLSKVFAPLAIIGSLGGCVSSNQGALLGAAGGYAAATELGASSEVAVLAAVGGLILGQNLGNPCNTSVSGTAREGHVNGITYGSQDQQTSYKCNTIGAPQGANPPAFR